MVFNAKKYYYAVLFPPISVGRLNNLLGFGVELKTILQILNEYMRDKNKLIYNKLSNSLFEYQSYSNRVDKVMESVFIIYYDNTK